MIITNIQFRDNSDAVVEQVKSILSNANVNFQIQYPKTESVCAGFSGNSYYITSNLKLVSDYITVEFTGMGGYYTEFALDLISIAIDTINTSNLGA